MPRKKSVAAKIREAAGAESSPPPATAPEQGPNGYAQRGSRGAAAILPIGGGGLATYATLSAEPLEWLLPGLVPRGELVLLAGPSECGKSTFIASVIAQVSGTTSVLGLPFTPASSSILYALEEDARGAPRERLIAAGADLSRVVSGDRLPDDRPAPIPYLPDGIGAFRQRIIDCRASLVAIDPLTSMLASGTNTNDGQHVRAVLVPLQEIARSMGVTILFTLNYRKSTTGDASNWVAGSKDWWNVPRHILAFGRDPGRTDRYVCAVGKQSRGRKRASICYRITEVRGGGWWEPLGDSITTAHDLGCDMEDELARSARQLARDYLRQVLTAEDCRVSKMLMECQGGGFSPHTLERAAADLGVRKEFRDTAGERAWWWMRPAKWLD